MKRTETPKARTIPVTTSPAPGAWTTAYLGLGRAGELTGSRLLGHDALVIVCQAGERTSFDGERQDTGGDPSSDARAAIGRIAQMGVDVSLVIFGEAADPYAAAFQDEFVRASASHPHRLRVTALWVLPEADKKPKSCYEAAKFLRATVEQGERAGAWTLVTPELLALARGLGPSSDPLSGDDFLATLVRALGSARFAETIHREADESRLPAFVLAPLVGASLVVVESDSSGGEAAVANLVRLASMAPLLDVELRETVVATCLVELSRAALQARDPRSIERQVTAAVSGFAPESLSAAAVPQGIATENNYYASAVLAVAGPHMSEALAPIFDRAARWSAGDGAAVAQAARDAVRTYDMRSAKLLKSHA